MKKKILIGTIIILVIAICITSLFIYKNMNQEKINYNDKSDDGTFSTAFIKASHQNTSKENYMISPYSVEIALSMLRDGTENRAYKEINKVCPKRNIKTLIVKDKVNVANAMFIKNRYKDDVKKEYIDNLKNNYNADFLYDDFSTPDVINDWVNKETNGMIDKVMEDISPEFLVGIANAVAMEEEWQDPFKCELIMKDDFTKEDGKKVKVSMLHKSYTSNASYYKDDSAEAIVIPYQKYDRKTGKVTEDDGEQLEFIGILPNDIDEYIKKLNLDTIKKIDKEKETAEEDVLDIYLKLPKFTFSYDFEGFKKTLKDMGITTVFTTGDLTNMLDNHPDAYVQAAIHKTFVKVDEKGTKAAAVTYFGVDKNAAREDKTKHIEMTFNKPFIFIIKDTKSNELLFFGVVYEPNKYEKPNCE